MHTKTTGKQQKPLRCGGAAMGWALPLVACLLLHNGFHVSTVHAFALTNEIRALAG